MRGGITGALLVPEVKARASGGLSERLPILTAPEVRRRGERGGVAMDPAPSFGMDEGSTQDGVDLAYGRGRQRAAAAASSPSTPCSYAASMCCS
jgi:hypothetical protein